MINKAWTIVSVVLLLGWGTAQAAPERVGDFALLDYEGEFHQFSRYLHKQAVVLMALDTECASMLEHIATFEALGREWREQEIEFLFIDSRDLGRREFNALLTDLPVLEDSGQLVSESLDIIYAGDVVVLEPRRSSLYYQGPMGEQLVQTLSATVAGTVDETLKVDGGDCRIRYPVKEAHDAKTPDYASEVAPIIKENCSECHRQDGVGPFAIDSHIMLMGWSPMIREVLINKRMPPTQIDPYVGHSDNARYISREELQTLVHWIDAGAPRGDGQEDPLESLDFSNRKTWHLGEPDYVVRGPANEVPPTGVLDYIYVDVELPFEQDKWINAVQYLAGDESVLHHLMTYVTAPDEDFWGLEADSNSVTRRFVEGYAPGTITAVEFPQDTAVHVPAGHKLSMQFHYVTNGRATVDETLLGLYLQDEAPKYEKLTQAVSARFEIPPNDNNYELQAEHVFAEDVIVTGVRAHMHFRGKDMKFAISQPDGSLKDILSIPAYNYGWQPHYILSEPQLVKAGSRILVTGAFDNSESNPSNPDPEKSVGFGLESWDEMFAGYFTFHQAPD